MLAMSLIEGVANSCLYILLKCLTLQPPKYTNMNIIRIFSLLVLISACTPKKDEKKTEVVKGIDPSNMDLSISPKEDFYQFANGQWLEKTEIPANEGRWGGFSELGIKNKKVVLEILKTAGNSDEHEDGSDQKKAIDFFAVGMDSTLAETIGPKALDSWYKRIDALQNKEEVQDIVAGLHKAGYEPFHSVFVMANLMDSDVNAFYFGSGGIGLPNRDYYTKEDSKSKEIREKYVAHLSRMLDLSGAGSGDPDAGAKTIMDIEMELALATKTPIEQRNIPALYNPMTVAGLQDISSAFKWDKYLNDIGVATVDTMIVTEPEFMKELSRVIQDHPLDELKTYLKWHVVNRAAPYLNHELIAADFEFFGTVLRGTKENKPRWERVLDNTNRALGEAVGKLYVEETFPPEAKAMAEAMVNNLKLAFESRIKNLPWMSDETKAMALKKLGTFRVKIGYPNKWKDYSGLQVGSEGEGYSYLNNIENAAVFAFEEDIDKVGKPVDKEEWAMTPQTVNAYYNPLNNEIVFPAAILQPPFFNFNADPAVNYGGIGAVIGHEISHGFDDQGSRFDAEGNMINWWTAEDQTRFEERTKMLVAQFDAYQPLDSLNVQGELTLGENIGDLGGLNAAYDALQIHFQNNEKPGPIDGFTQEQRFFISWATIWRTKYRDETLRNQVMTDPHSPGMFRAVGPLENIESFYQAFDIREGDKLYKPDSLRVKIW